MSNEENVADIWEDSTVLWERGHGWPRTVYIHYNDVIMTTIASQITSLVVVYSIVYSGADQRKHQSSTSLAFVRGNHRGPVNSPHKWPVTRKIFPFDDIIMFLVVSLCFLQYGEYWYIVCHKAWAPSTDNIITHCQVITMTVSCFTY